MATTNPALSARESRARGARGIARWLVAVGALGAISARAEVQFDPQIVFGVAHTDNLTLARTDEEPQTVYELVPSFRFSQQSPRVTANAAYRIEAYDYHERDDSSVYHRLDGNMRLALDPDNFFLDLGANRDQTIVDPSAPVPRSNLPISTNRINRDEVYVGPEFQYALAGNATVNGSVRRSVVRYRDLDPMTGDYARDFDQDVVAFGVDNYRRQRGFTWAVRYNSDKTTYELFPSYKYAQATVELGGWVTRGLRLFAAGGKESPWDMPFDSELRDTFWEAGFSTQQRERFHAEVAAGERSYGSSRRASVDLSFAHGSMTVSYNEQPMTQGRDPYLGGLLSPNETQDFLGRIGSAERYLSKQWRWSTAFDLRRTSISLSAFDESRDDRIRLDGTPLGNESQKGSSVSVSRRAGARTEFVLDLWYVHREFVEVSTSSKVDATAATFRVNYALGSRTQLSLEYSRSKEDSVEGSLEPGYAANLISVLLTRNFGAGTTR